MRTHEQGTTMRAFLYTYQWHYAVFAIDDRGDIWRFYFDDPNQPYMMKLTGDEAEFAGPIGVLKSMMRASRS